jgi:ATP-dependent protease Clp ATPase subunit
MEVIHVDRVLRCDFCLNTERRIEVLIAGDRAHICGDCVRVCVEIIGKHYATTPTDPTTAPAG